MVDWIIMGIIFAILALFAIYIIRKKKNRSRREEFWKEKKGFWGWLGEWFGNTHY